MPDNFGYNGDYALYGSSNETKTGKEEMKTGMDTKNKDELIWKGFYASDHLPVISETNLVGGKKTRRRNKKNKKSVRKYKHKK